MQSIHKFVEGLSRFRESDFTIINVHQFLQENPVVPESLQPFLHFSSSHYTRNLVYRSELFELMVICWDIGQRSRVHNHQGQNCWMAVPIGRLVVQNYSVIRQDESMGFCELEEADEVLVDSRQPSFVDPAIPVHAVANPVEFDQRAASLHVYSRPYDRCMIYVPERKSCAEVQLYFDTEYGKKVIQGGR